MLFFPCSAAFQTATTRRRSYTERQSRTRSTSSMILPQKQRVHFWPQIRSRTLNKRDNRLFTFWRKKDMSQSTALDSLSLNRPLCICVSQSKNCHESKNDVRNALAAQIRKLEPKNYLETFKNKNLSLSTATTRRRSYTERQSRTRSTSSMIHHFDFRR